MVAVEMCVRTLVSSKMSNVKVVIRSDNMGVVGALKKSCSRGSEQNYILGKIIGLMQEHQIWVECVWISTHHMITQQMVLPGVYSHQNICYTTTLQQYHCTSSTCFILRSLLRTSV
ncbi:hypothetical protein FB446DRAFT_655057 [Lentinula raphanica]|nr:hypothetical protein FB446DRAFT_655057 [Lentinula raphanica]